MVRSSNWSSGAISAHVSEIAKGYTEYMVTGAPATETIGAKKGKRFLGIPITRGNPGKKVTTTPVEMRDRTTGTRSFTNARPSEMAPGYATRVDKFTLPEYREVHRSPGYRGVSKARFDLLGTKRLKDANASYKQATAKLGRARLDHDKNMAAGRKAKQSMPDTGTPLRDARKEYRQARGERGKAILGIGSRAAVATGASVAGVKGAQLYGSGVGQQMMPGPAQQDLGVGTKQLKQLP